MIGISGLLGAFLVGLLVPRDGMECSAKVGGVLVMPPSPQTYMAQIFVVYTGPYLHSLPKQYNAS
jgi:hypothetical protein